LHYGTISIFAGLLVHFQPPSHFDKEPLGKCKSNAELEIENAVRFTRAKKGHVVIVTGRHLWSLKAAFAALVSLPSDHIFLFIQISTVLYSHAKARG